MLSVGKVLLYSFFMDPKKKADRLNTQYVLLWFLFVRVYMYYCSYY